MKALLLLLVATVAQAALERDCIATGYTHPFLCDGEMLARRDDATALVRVRLSPLTIAVRHLDSVSSDGQPVAVRREGNVWRAEVPPGDHLVAVSSRTFAGRDAAVPWVSPPAKPLAALTPPVDANGEMVLPDGIYTDARLDLTASGSAARPLVVRAQTPGQVILRGKVTITLRGDFIWLQGLRFEHCSQGITVNVLGSDCRVTQCLFFDCGQPRTTFAHIVELGGSGARNRVDHCYFTRSKSMSLAQRVSLTDKLGTEARFDHNTLRDIWRYFVNGQEPLQIGQNQRGASGRRAMRCTAEANLFDHVNGDTEIISNKSSANTIRDNTAVWCDQAAFTLRGGDDVSFERNRAVGCRAGLRVYGSRHVIADNLFLDAGSMGIQLGNGGPEEESNYKPATDCRITGNTIAGCAGPCIAIQPGSETFPLLSSGVMVRGNTLVGATPFDLDKGALVQEGNRLSEPSPNLPGDLPPRPLLSVDLHRGPALAPAAPAADTTLTDGGQDLPWTLPPACVLTWQQRSTAWTSRASLMLPGGRRLEWHGVAADGKPDGVIALREADGTLLAEAADIAQYYQNYREQRWMGKTVDTATGPNPAVWLEFTWLQAPDFCLLLAGPAGKAVPVLGWPGAAPGGRARLAQTGTGLWRQVAAFAWREVDPTPPTAPVAKAASTGDARLTLTWPAQPGVRYAVRRDGKPMASDLAVGRYDDFEVAAGARYRYQVTARTPAAEVDGPELTATFAPTGRVYRLTPAALVLPPGSAPAMEQAPAQTALDLRLTVPHDGAWSLYGRVKAPDDGANSFWSRIGEQPPAIWHLPVEGQWRWRPLFTGRALSAGELRVRVYCREPGTGLDALLLTDDAPLTPDGGPMEPGK